jgi:DNA-binding MarR family transcriptional regulator
MDNYNEDSVYYVFGQVIRFHYCRMHMLLEKVGVYPGQPPLLFALGKQAGLSQKELANRLHIKAATITVMLNRMETAGLIERRPDDNDQRVSRVYLTEQGKIVLGEVKKALKIIEEECFNSFTTEEQILLRRLLMQIRDNLVKACGKYWNE